MAWGLSKPKGPPPNATYECLACEHEWRGMRDDERRCPSCFSSRIDHLNVVHPEELLLEPGAPLPEGVPAEIPNSAIYLWSERRKRPPPRGTWKIRRLG